ncbi:MAG: hypothetical protein ACXABN_09610 [Candidatus Thorarchaeota archaeon]
MSMEDGVQEESTSLRVVRGMNTIRIPLYLSVAFIHMPILSECVASGGPCDPGIVLVPLGLAALDAFMVIWSRDRKIGVGFLGFILSILSLGIVANSLLPYIPILLIGYFHVLLLNDYLLIILGLMIGLASFAELISLVYESIQIPQKPPDSTSVIRTYET